MARFCKVCGEQIPEGRIEALPDTKTCTLHSATDKVGAFPIISSKNTYSQIQVMPAEQARRLHKAQNRRGMSPGLGMMKGLS